MPTREFVPYLSVTDDTDAIAFYSRVFETVPTLLLSMPDARLTTRRDESAERAGFIKGTFWGQDSDSS